jgi:hypothetical protein
LTHRGANVAKRSLLVAEMALPGRPDPVDWWRPETHSPPMTVGESFVRRNRLGLFRVCQVALLTGSPRGSRLQP